MTFKIHKYILILHFSKHPITSIVEFLRNILQIARFARNLKKPNNYLASYLFVLRKYNADLSVFDSIHLEVVKYGTGNLDI